MDKIDYWLITSFLILVIVTIYTLININSFMPIERTCESGIAMINKCGCMPDSGFAHLFNVNYTEVKVNLSNYG